MAGIFVLTDLERRILDFIVHYAARNDKRTPTLREIGEAVSIRSRGTLHRYVQSLRRKGYLRKSGRGWRNIRLTRDYARRVTVLPVGGVVGDGRSIRPATGQEEVNFSDLLLGPDRYVLVVSGDSMEDAGIRDGDMVIVNSARTAESDDIVVALVDNGKATLKRLRTHGDRIELIPADRSLASMIYPAGRVRFQGVVIAQVRML